MPVYPHNVGCMAGSKKLGAGLLARRMFDRAMTARVDSGGTSARRKIASLVAAEAAT